MDGKFFLAAFIVLAFSVSAFALTVDFDQRHQIVPVSTDESINTVTVSGTADGAAEEFTYVVIGPAQVQVRSGIGMLDGNVFSITYDVPTIGEFADLGVPAAESRAAIPLHTLITFTDAGNASDSNSTNTSMTNQTFHAHVVVTTDKFQSKMQNMAGRLQNIAEHAENLEERFSSLADRAESRGLDDVAQVLRDKSTLAHHVAEAAGDLKAAIEALAEGGYDSDTFKNALSEFRDNFHEMRGSGSMGMMRNAMGEMMRGR